MVGTSSVRARLSVKKSASCNNFQVALAFVSRDLVFRQLFPNSVFRTLVERNSCPSIIVIPVRFIWFLWKLVRAIRVSQVKAMHKPVEICSDANNLAIVHFWIVSNFTVI